MYRNALWSASPYLTSKSFKAYIQLVVPSPNLKSEIAQGQLMAGSKLNSL
jgi:hypothetical protein